MHIYAPPEELQPTPTGKWKSPENSDEGKQR